MPRTEKQKPKMKSFALSEQELANLLALAKTRKVSHSAVIRRALNDLYMKNGLTTDEWTD